MELFQQILCKKGACYNNFVRLGKEIKNTRVKKCKKLDTAEPQPIFTGSYKKKCTFVSDKKYQNSIVLSHKKCYDGIVERSTRSRRDIKSEGKVNNVQSSQDI